MRQLLTIAKLVFIKVWRNHLIPALFLIMLPLLLAAWSFESANPGFQTGFLADLGGGLMSLFAGLLVIIIGYDHLFWACEQNTPWFYLSRTGNRALFAGGRFAGTAGVLFVALALAAAIFTLFLRLNTGVWLILPSVLAVLVFCEFALLGSVITLLAAFMTRLPALGVILVIYAVGHNSDAIRMAAENHSSPLLNLALTVALAIIPDFSLFRSAWFVEPQAVELMLAALYAAGQAMFYLVAAGIVLQRRDL